MLIIEANVERWERAVNDDEEELERAKQAEQKQMSEIDKDMRKLDDFKSQRMSKKNDLDNMDEDIAKVSADILLQHTKNFILFFKGSPRCRQCSERSANYSKINHWSRSED